MIYQPSYVLLLGDDGQYLLIGVDCRPPSDKQQRKLCGGFGLPAHGIQLRRCEILPLKPCRSPADFWPKGKSLPENVAPKRRFVDGDFTAEALAAVHTA